MSEVVNTETQAIAEVQRQSKAGVDFIKIYATVPTHLTKVIIEEAHRHKKKVIGHLEATSWKDAVGYGIDGLVHTPLLNSQNFDLYTDSTTALLQLMASKKIANDPTLYVLKCDMQRDSTPDYIKEHLPFPLTSGWRQENGVMNVKVIPYENFDTLYQGSLRYVKRAYDLGVAILVGSDFNNPNTIPGYSLHKELQELATAGISPDSLIKMVTYKAAQWLGVLDTKGTIEKGKEADLVILDKNPLLNIANTLAIHMVIQQGKVVDRNALVMSKNN